MKKSPFFSQIDALSKALSSINKISYASQMTALSQALSKISYAPQMDALYKALSGINKISYASQMTAFPQALSKISYAPQMDSLSKALSGLNKITFIPEINAMTKAFTILQQKTIHPKMTDLTSQLSSIQHAFQQMNTLIASFPILQVKPIFPETAAINNLIKKSNSFITTYNDIISVNIESQLISSNEENVELAANEMHINFSEVRKDKLSLDFYYSAILSFLLFIYSEYSSLKGINELKTTINNTETKIIKEIKNLEYDLIPSVYYVIIRQTFGYEYPSTKSNINLILYSNQKVRLIENKGKWIHVEYFNYFTNKHEHAWCMKKYLKMLRIN
jgi:hypothetical protein